MLNKHRGAKWMMVATLAVALSSCTFLDSFVPKKGEKTDVIDRQQNLTVDDFRNLNKIDQSPEGKEAVKTTAALGAPPVPDLAQVLAAPRPPKVANTKLVTLSVTEDVPVRDVLFELGRLANVDIEVGTGLDKGGINLRATDRPFNEVIERIAELANLRYSTSGNSIRVERDTPYIKNYPLDFLNIVRSSTSGYNLSTNILSGGNSSGGSSGGSSGSSSSGSSSGGNSSVGTSGSSSSITSQAESDLWSSLDASIAEILNYQATGGLSTGTDSTGAPLPAANNASGAQGAGGSNNNFVINRQAGILSVNATERQHEMVQRFLSLMTRNSSAQVLIEAKIVEVSLSDEFASGVDWNKVLGNVNKSYIGFGSYLPTNPVTGQTLAGASDSTTQNNPAFSFGVSRGELGAVVALTQQFGTTRTLSSPRLSAINNQQAVLTFARNEVFFDCQYTPGTTTSSTGSSVTSQPTFNCSQNTVPIGIILNILPSINLDTQEVTLNVRPTLTRQVATALNPQTGYLNGTLTGTTIPNITVPVIEVREIDSITKVKSGGVMIIGGLMEDATRNTDSGAPGLGEIPIFGNLFKSRSESSNKRELIIFIKATIVNPDGSSHPIDRAVYDKYVTDPRPLFPKGQE